MPGYPQARRIPPTEHATMRNEQRTLADPLETLGLDPTQTALYTAVLRLHRATRSELAEVMNGPVDTLA
ncbi:hypothetical protein ACFSTC_51360 [Nonomuraea ferruginea]